MKKIPVLGQTIYFLSWMNNKPYIVTSSKDEIVEHMKKMYALGHRPDEFSLNTNIRPLTLQEFKNFTNY